MKFTERNALQLAVLLFAFVPVLTGGAGMFLGKDMLGPNDANLAIDSHFRYLSGLLFGLGITFWASVKHIERYKTRCRVLTFIVFIGGLARLYGLIFVGWPSMGMALAILMELVVTPALCLWQTRIAKLEGHKTL